MNFLLERRNEDLRPPLDSERQMRELDVLGLMSQCKNFGEELHETTRHFLRKTQPECCCFCILDKSDLCVYFVLTKKLM